MTLEEVPRYRTTFWVQGWNLIAVTELFYYIIDESLKEYKRFNVEDWLTDVDTYAA